MSKSFALKMLTTLLAVFLILPLSTRDIARAQETKVLDQASLKTMLENLGYEPQDRKFESGNPYFHVKVRGWSVTVSLPKSAQFLYAQMWFSIKPDVKQIPNEVLASLLRRNAWLNYTHFFLSKSGSIVLSGQLVNENIRPPLMRKTIDELVVTAEKTRNLWDPKKWPKNEESKAAEKKDSTADKKKKSE